MILVERISATRSKGNDFRTTSSYGSSLSESGGRDGGWSGAPVQSSWPVPCLI